ncbi:hypothetical protein [Niabella aurantiaca]|uniref:hypothetical protein n=1 Tax=Niabella aurantiaca TaxID=379900 RepID=UPI00037E0910|nr:hypothetical protein [Niabella aurantiaca]
MPKKETEIINTWDDIVKDWELLPLETLIFIFTQAKDRYEELLSESESITNKTFFFIKTTTASSIAATVYFLKTPSYHRFIWIAAILFVVTFSIYIYLLSPKKVIYRGSSPKEIFISYLDNKSYATEEKTKLAYYHELIRYQDRIESMTGRNDERNMWYKIALVLSVSIFILFTSMLISSILRLS